MFNATTTSTQAPLKRSTAIVLVTIEVNSFVGRSNVRDYCRIATWFVMKVWVREVLAHQGGNSQQCGIKFGLDIQANPHIV